MFKSDAFSLFAIGNQNKATDSLSDSSRRDTDAKQFDKFDDKRE